MSAKKQGWRSLPRWIRCWLTPGRSRRGRRGMEGLGVVEPPQCRWPPRPGLSGDYGRGCRESGKLHADPGFLVNPGAAWASYWRFPSKEFAMGTQTPAKGPASYFPSIERSYGKPVAHWLSVLDQTAGLKHMDQVALLKQTHGLGHGHANALVAWHRAQRGTA